MIEHSLRRVNLQWAERDLQAMRNVYTLRQERGAKPQELADLRQMLKQAQDRYALLAQLLEEGQ